MKLRPYQEKAVESVLNEWDRGVDKTLLVMATGTGKTIVFSKIIEEKVRQGDRCLVLAHRGELLEQAQDKIKKASGLMTALEKAESTSLDSWARVTVGSIQSLTQDKRLEKFSKDHFDVIVIDEAHHALSPSYQKVLNYFDKAKVLGVTATPDRGDMKNLGQYFESMAFEYGMAQGIREKYLSPIKSLSLPIEIDFKGVKKTVGDYQASAVAHRVEPYLEAIAEEMVKICMGRKTVVFMPLIDTSRKFVNILNDKGFNAVEINGETEDRKEILNDFENSKYNIICNAMLLTEGWDCPSVDTIVVLRPTKIRSLYSQMVGRGTRLYEGKTHLLLLDFLWMTEEHDLCHPSTLISKDYEVIKKAQEIQEESNVPLDLEELVEEAESEVVEEREKALAERLNKMRRRKKKLVDPIQYSISIKSMDLVNYTPSFGWESEKPTNEQIKILENMDIDGEALENKGQADILIKNAAERKNNNMATPKQIRLLEQRGFNHVGEWTKEEAGSIIARLQANGWRYVKGINPSTYNPKDERKKKIESHYSKYNNGDYHLEWKGPHLGIFDKDNKNVTEEVTGNKGFWLKQKIGE